MRFTFLLIYIYTVLSAQNILALGKVGLNREKPTLRSIKLNDNYLFPENMRTLGDSCFGNTLIEVNEGQVLRVEANREFIMYLTTEFTDSYYNLQQYYGENLEDITLNSLVLAREENSSEIYTAKLPLTLKCKYNLHPYFRIKAYMSIKFYQESANLEEKKEFNILLVCAKPEEIKAFTNFYIPGYIIFWMLLNLTLQVYHNYGRDLDHFIIFVIYLVGSMIIQNDLLAYFVAGVILILIVLKQRKNHTINHKMFTLYMFFSVIVSIQILITFQGGKQHQLWNSFWIALDNFIILHISMFLILRLVKLNRFRHVFWYFIAVAVFSVLYQGNNNRFFELQFKNPLNLTCIKIEVFFPIMMLPISNFYSTITNWMHRVICLAILIAAVLPLEWAIKFMAMFLFSILFFEIYKKNIEVIRHRC